MNIHPVAVYICQFRGYDSTSSYSERVTARLGTRPAWQPCPPGYARVGNKLPSVTVRLQLVILVDAMQGLENKKGHNAGAHSVTHLFW